MSQQHAQTLIILEPDESQRKGLVHALTPYFGDIRATDDPVETFVWLQRETVTMILTEFQFSSMEGAYVIQRLKQLAPTSRLIVMTVLPNPGLEKTFRKISVEGVIGKPVEMKNLLELVVNQG